MQIPGEITLKVLAERCTTTCLLSQSQPPLVRDHKTRRLCNASYQKPKCNIKITIYIILMYKFPSFFSIAYVISLARSQRGR
ncbi:hypothetical protein K456DRAFT_521387 [Colletotrichum gloeosporioides 23]|nr:hypothetical protein K456DRAFT_521387 [Colletotrichum gloeosporioides 23]